MSDKVQQLFPNASGVVPAEVNQEIVDRLEELLSRAKAGHIQGFVYAAVMANGASSDGWITPRKVNELILAGAVLLLQSRMSRAFRPTTPEDP